MVGFYSLVCFLVCSFKFSSKIGNNDYFIKFGKSVHDSVGKLSSVLDTIASALLATVIVRVLILFPGLHSNFKLQ